MRAHLRSCSRCRRFQQELVQRPRELAMLAPPLPVAAGAALIAQLLPASGAATAGILTASSAAGTMAALAPKAVATIAVIVAAAGGTAAVRHSAQVHPTQRPADMRPAPAKAPEPTRSSSVETAVRTPPPDARALEFPVKAARHPVGSERSTRRKRAHVANRRAPRKRENAGAREHPVNAVKARGRSLRAPVSRPATAKVPAPRSSAAGRATPIPAPATANGRSERGHPALSRAPGASRKPRQR